MKLIKTLTALAFAAALTMGVALADEKEHKQGACCKKASEKGEACAHKCCVEAAKNGKECEKCGGKGEIPKKEKKKDS